MSGYCGTFYGNVKLVERKRLTLRFWRKFLRIERRVRRWKFVGSPFVIT